MDVYFPITHKFCGSDTDGIGGPAVDDAGTLFIIRDEDDPEDWPDNNPDAAILIKKTSLTEMVASCLDGWRNGDGYTDKDHVPASDALAAALRAAADMLDAGKRK